MKNQRIDIYKKKGPSLYQLYTKSIWIEV